MPPTQLLFKSLYDLVKILYSLLTTCIRILFYPTDYGPRVYFLYTVETSMFCIKGIKRAVSHGKSMSVIFWFNKIWIIYILKVSYCTSNYNYKKTFSLILSFNYHKPKNVSLKILKGMMKDLGLTAAMGWVTILMTFHNTNKQCFQLN